MTRRAPVRAQAAAPRSSNRAAAAKRKVERSGSLKERRRKARTQLAILWCLLIAVALGGLIYAAWLPAFRVATVEAEGLDPEGIALVAEEALVGRQFLILPRDSIFLVPESDIRARVLAAYPAVQAVSIDATGLDSLKVSVIGRASSFIWCGESVDVPRENCYQADGEGLVFAPAERPVGDETATTSAATTTLLDIFSKKSEQAGDASLFVYGPLEGAEDGPIRAHVTYASALPGALKFVKGMRALGADIRSVTLRGDEIDLHTRAGTRITYVIGEEGHAAVLASTAFPSLNLNDGSIEYVDLRFENKVYLRRRDE